MKTIRTHFLDFSDQLSPACGLLLSVLENKIFKERTLGVFVCLIDWLAFLFSVLENKPTAYVQGRHSVFGIPSPKLTFWHMVFSWFYFFLSFSHLSPTVTFSCAFSYRVGSFILCSDMSSVLIGCVLLVEPLLVITQLFYQFQFLNNFWVVCFT